MSDLFLNNGVPIIQCGTIAAAASWNPTGTISVTFDTQFSSTPVIIATPIKDNNNMITVMIDDTNTNTNSTKFTAYVIYKDGNGGQAGGGEKNAPFHWIAVNPGNLFLNNDVPIIQCGKIAAAATWSGTGEITVSFGTSFSAAPIVNVTPIKDSNKMITVMIHTVTASSFQAYELHKDGRGGQDGGGVKNETCHWIAVAPASS